MIVASQLIRRVAGVTLTLELSVATSQNSDQLPVAATPTATQKPMIRAVTTGPATATLNSSPGDSVSPVIFAMPPKNHRSMPEIPIPRRRATSAWPSSCSTSEPKNSSALATAVR